MGSRWEIGLDNKVLWIYPDNLKRVRCPLQLKYKNANHSSTKTCQVTGCETPNQEFNLDFRVTRSGQHWCRACGKTMGNCCAKQAKVYGYPVWFGNNEGCKTKPVCKNCYQWAPDEDQISRR